MMRSISAAFVMGAFVGVLFTLLALPRFTAMAPIARDVVTLQRADLVQLQQAADSVTRHPEGYRFQSSSGEIAMECLPGGNCNLEVPARPVARAEPSGQRELRVADTRTSDSRKAVPVIVRSSIGASEPPPSGREVRYVESELSRVDRDSAVADPQVLPTSLAGYDDPAMPRLVTPLDGFDLRKGDVILEVDGKVITSPLEAFGAQRGAKVLVVRRDGAEVKLHAQP